MWLQVVLFAVFCFIVPCMAQCNVQGMWSGKELNVTFCNSELTEMYNFSQSIKNYTFPCHLIYQTNYSINGTQSSQTMCFLDLRINICRKTGGIRNCTETCTPARDSALECTPLVFSNNCQSLTFAAVFGNTTVHYNSPCPSELLYLGSEKGAAKDLNPYPSINRIY